jgi:hypothetical protein
MNELWLGASTESADYIFLLPNKPEFPPHFLTKDFTNADVATLIEVNGNHWRKIFTIMAKLAVPDDSTWRTFRDVGLLERVGIAFSVDQIHNFKGIVFIVGKTFESVYPVPDHAELIGDKHQAKISLPYIWCPYLDYRQFPNSLIEALRECILEK